MNARLVLVCQRYLLSSLEPEEVSIGGESSQNKRVLSIYLKNKNVVPDSQEVIFQ